MRIALIVAVTRRGGVIGCNNRLPWKLRDDMRLFREHTVGKPVVMGRHTWESLRGPLADRLNIVVTHDAEYSVPPSVRVATTIDEALATAQRERPEADEVMVIGGGTLYEQLLRQADRIYLTEVDAEVEGDTFFPQVDPSEWDRSQKAQRFERDERNEHPFTFHILERRPSRAVFDSDPQERRSSERPRSVQTATFALMRGQGS
jgi:dihydrofolate reductase